jgi:hypothetical protein
MSPAFTGTAHAFGLFAKRRQPQTLLGPPNGNSVPVTVSGGVSPGTQPLSSGGTTYTVIDQYGQDQPSGSFTLDEGGSYSFQGPLIAARNGYDPNGRTYMIVVVSPDAIGNVGTCSTAVTVPHDQSN